MTDPGVTIVGSARSITFKIDTSAVRRVFGGMPRVAYFWTRDFLFRAFVQHRVRWLQQKGTQFGRGDDKSKAIRVSRINEGSTGEIAPNEVRYRVHPAAKRQPDSASASRGLDEMFAEAATGNEVLRVHEFGEDIRSSDYMFVPVKTRPGRFSKWRAQHSGARLLRLPSKTQHGTQLIYEVQGARGRPGRPRKGEERQTKLRLRWLLTRFVRMRPTLQLYDSWDAMSGLRDQLWRDVADKMQRDFDRADPRDL